MKKVHLTLRGASVDLFSLLIPPLLVLTAGHAVGIGATTTTAAALTVAFPISPVAVLLAHKYDAEQSDELASALVLSVVLSIVTLAVWSTVTS